MAGPRIILGQTTNDPLWATPLDTSTGDAALALYIQAEAAGSADDKHRAIHWNSDVVINSGPSPLLIVGPGGTVVTSINITVNGVSNPAPGHALPAHPYIEVNDLVNQNTGNVWMQSAGGTIDVARSSARTTGARSPSGTTGRRSRSSTSRTATS